MEKKESKKDNSGVITYCSYLVWVWMMFWNETQSLGFPVWTATKDWGSKVIKPCSRGAIHVTPINIHSLLIVNTPGQWARLETKIRKYR